MAAFKLYEWEHKTYPKFQELKLSRSDAPIFFKKLAIHFKVSVPYLSRRNEQIGNGMYYGINQTIALAPETDLGIVIHEFAHHLTRARWGGGHHHDKKFKRELKKAYTFAKRYVKN